MKHLVEVRDSNNLWIQVEADSYIEAIDKIKQYSKEQNNKIEKVLNTRDIVFRNITDLLEEKVDHLIDVFLEG